MPSEAESLWLREVVSGGSALHGDAIQSIVDRVDSAADMDFAESAKTAWDLSEMGERLIRQTAKPGGPVKPSYRPCYFCSIP